MCYRLYPLQGLFCGCLMGKYVCCNFRCKVKCPSKCTRNLDLFKCYILNFNLSECHEGSICSHPRQSDTDTLPRPLSTDPDAKVKVNLFHFRQNNYLVRIRRELCYLVFHDESDPPLKPEFHWFSHFVCCLLLDEYAEYEY